MKTLRNFLLVAVVSALTFEILSYIASRNGLLIFNNAPPYAVAFDGTEWRNEKHSWGAWHKASASDEHVATCFNVKYESNSIGARDDIEYNDALESGSVAVIGDSFVEGYGVQLADTFAKILQKYYGRVGLNFGASGDFGPVQQYLLYKKMIKGIPHQEVILFVLPENDFTDNSDQHMSRFGQRYRPYFKKIDKDEYEIVYPIDAKPSDRYPSNRSKFRNGTLNYFLKVFNGFTYSSNSLRSVLYLFSARGNRKRDKKFDLRRYGYFINDTYDVNGSLYFIRKLMEEVPVSVKKHIVVIPTAKDFRNIGKFGFAYKKLDWYLGLREIAEKHDARFIDLAEAYLADQSGQSAGSDFLEWFLPCDPHWSAKGNLLTMKQFLKGAEVLGR